MFASLFKKLSVSNRHAARFIGPKAKPWSPKRRSLAFRPGLEILEQRQLLSGVPLGTAQLAEAYGRVPLSFEANQGQTDARVDFLSRGDGYALFLTPGEAVFELGPAGPTADTASTLASTVLRLDLIGSNATAQARGLDALPGTSNYFVGNDPQLWQSGITNYAQVEYANVYPGVDLLYYGNQRQLEYDFVVAPGASPGAIRLAFQGADGVTLDSAGNLVLHTAGGDVVQHAPILYQENDGVRRAVSGRFVLQGDGQVGFEVGAYDASRPLVIDPVLSYSTYLGGSGDDQGNGIAVDAAGSAYVVGTTYSTSFPGAGSLGNPNKGIPPFSNGPIADVFVAKFNPAGTALVYSTYLGGNDLDYGNGIAVDAAGNAWVTGRTDSANFPTTANAVEGTATGAISHAFVAKLNPSGTGLVYSTYLGGHAQAEGVAIAVDKSGSAYVTGDTLGGNFPTKSAFQPKPSGDGSISFDAFVTKIDAGGSLIYSSYLGGSQYNIGDTNDYGFDFGKGIAVDGAGNAYITGTTTSTNFPTPGTVPQTIGVSMTSKYTSKVQHSSAFVAKVNAAGSGFGYFDYIGGGSDDEGHAIAVDAAGDAYVTGVTDSSDFPVSPNAFRTTRAGINDAFVIKLSPVGARVYGTYLGGDAQNNGFGIAVDAAGDAFATGKTDSGPPSSSSSGFPIVNPLQGKLPNVGYSVFVTALNAAGTDSVFSTYLTGKGLGGQGNAIAVDAAGNCYVTGYTQATDFLTSNAEQPANGGGQDAFVAKIGFPATVQFSTPTYTVKKNGGIAIITVTRSDGLSSTVSVAYATHDGTAVAGVKYQAASGVLKFGPGETTKTFGIPILDNSRVDGDQTVNLVLSNVSDGAVLGSTATAVLTIADENLPRVPNSPRPANLGQVAYQLAQSREHYIDFITKAYHQYLGRAPDAAGLNGWLTVMLNGTVTDERLEAGFIGSPEYIQNHGGSGRGWVVGMYHDLLGRTPSDAEVNTFLAALANGTTTTQVAYAFAAGPEREGIRVRGDYATFLGRSATDAEVSGWVNAFLTGVTNEDVVAGFVGSAEYYNSAQRGRGNRAEWLVSAYSQVLFRDPSVGEINADLAILS
jgi:hypothetical protein